MKIAMVGTGYVGLVSGTCFADSGNTVTCVDIDEEKVAALKQGRIPIYEPGLSELVVRNVQAGRLLFTTDLSSAVTNAQIVYLAVGTPQDEDGSADLAALMSVVDDLATDLAHDAIVVVKSTVPVGTNAQVKRRLEEITGRSARVVSNPEFLKEGAAIDDFVRPDRVVVGVRSEADARIMRDLYGPFLRNENPLLVMSPESAELTKYAANAMLATKISFINHIARLCGRLGGDINEVRRGIGHDKRIGFSFLFPGVGYGGSCFPKDVRALKSMFGEVGIDPALMVAVDLINESQKLALVEKIDRHFDGQVSGKTIAVWGLAFKPSTDDIREAPSLVLIDEMLRRGARLAVHDPEAMENVKSQYGDCLTYGSHPFDVLDGADALAINTEWSEFRHPDFAEIKRRMGQPVIFDGRNLYDPDQMRALGFAYYSIGRPVVS